MLPDSLFSMTIMKTWWNTGKGAAMARARTSAEGGGIGVADIVLVALIVDVGSASGVETAAVLGMAVGTVTEAVGSRVSVGAGLGCDSDGGLAASVAATRAGAGWGGDSGAVAGGAHAARSRTTTKAVIPVNILVAERKVSSTCNGQVWLPRKVAPGRWSPASTGAGH